MSVIPEEVLSDVDTKTKALAVTLTEHLRETTEEGMDLWLTEYTSLTTEVIDGGYRDLLLAGVYRQILLGVGMLAGRHGTEAVTKLT